MGEHSLRAAPITTPSPAKRVHSYEKHERALLLSAAPRATRKATVTFSVFSKPVVRLIATGARHQLHGDAFNGGSELADGIDGIAAAAAGLPDDVPSSVASQTLYVGRSAQFRRCRVWVTHGREHMSSWEQWHRL